jgi:hypothetical protein
MRLNAEATLKAPTARGSTTPLPSQDAQNAMPVGQPGASILQPTGSAPTIVSQLVTVIRVLDAEDWQALRDVRPRTLAEAPDAFASTFGRESIYDEAQWRDLAVTGKWFVAEADEFVGGRRRRRLVRRPPKP